MKKTVIFILAFFVCGLLTAATDDKILRGSDVPENWNGTWPEKFLTVPEKTDFTMTTSSYQIQEFINVIKWNSENVHVINMFITTLRKVGSAVVLANPRVTTPEEAKASGKPVIYLEGDIHPGGETETKEALLMLTRDILFGKKKYLLDDLIIIVNPSINPDGTDTRSTGRGIGSPQNPGTSRNALGLNLNRDAIKLESIELNGLYRTVFNPWDPVLIYDGHGLSGWYEYAIVYTTSTVPAGHPAPRTYVWDTLFPAVRKTTRKNFRLEVFTHCDLTPTYEGGGHPEDSSPTVYSMENAWSFTEAKTVMGAYGLRNRMSILAETGSAAGNPNYEKRIYVHYALVSEILDYSAKHGKEMVKICRDADQEVVDKVLAQAESGKLKNFVEGKYESYGKIDVRAYSKIKGGYGRRYIPGTSVRDGTPPGELGPPDLVYTVDYMAKLVGTKEATVPRGYLIPADMGFIAEKLRTHNVKVEVLDKPIKVTGEEFVIDNLVKAPRVGQPDDMVKLDGAFAKSPVKQFPAGTFHVDMAQPMANMAFYCLEPQAFDGFVAWDVLTDYLESIGVDKRSIVYPIYKYFKILE